MLTDEQKREALLIASVGCDRETAAKYIGCSLQQLNATAYGEPDFAEQLRRAEAGCELAHMRNIQQAARDERHWRASVWWLERRLPERYARRDAGAVGRRDLVGFLSKLSGDLAGLLRDTEDRERVLNRLKEAGESLSDPLLVEHSPDEKEGTTP
ncbi:hypothetical protein MalM25_34320 [Planctomycetes bacterium MalM25]|nr:hypothetical protein MalM25_34320 [Planctomycetes bacterium MalM25]